MFRPPLPPCTHLYALVLTPPPPLAAYVINGRPLCKKKKISPKIDHIFMEKKLKWKKKKIAAARLASILATRCTGNRFFFMDSLIPPLAFIS